MAGSNNPCVWYITDILFEENIASPIFIDGIIGHTCGQIRPRLGLSQCRHVHDVLASLWNPLSHVRPTLTCTVISSDYQLCKFCQDNADEHDEAYYGMRGYHKQWYSWTWIILLVLACWTCYVVPGCDLYLIGLHVFCLFVKKRKVSTLAKHAVHDNSNVVPPRSDIGHATSFWMHVWKASGLASQCSTLGFECRCCHLFRV
jgi:hypothetical protein